MPTLAVVPGHHLPQPRRERWPLAVAAALLLAGCAVLVFALRDDPARPAIAAPPPIVQPAPATIPRAAPAERAKTRRAAKRAGARNATSGQADGGPLGLRLESGWVESFYPIYAEAQRVYGVNWLLIASVHRQETAFPSHPTTYFGLNFAGCCGGPMQFNVTNGDKSGRGSTWDRYRFSYRAGKRPERYLSMRRRHPSLYDDFDAIMAAAHLLRDNGAGLTLDASAWSAAYLYYGPDLDGVSYASQVTARAIRWARSGFCAACADRPDLTARVDAAWGAPVRAELEARRAAAEQAAKAERAAERRRQAAGSR